MYIKGDGFVNIYMNNFAYDNGKIVDNILESSPVDFFMEDQEGLHAMQYPRSTNDGRDGLEKSEVFDNFVGTFRQDVAYSIMTEQQAGFKKFRQYQEQCERLGKDIRYIQDSSNNRAYICQDGKQVISCRMVKFDGGYASNILDMFHDWAKQKGFLDD